MSLSKAIELAKEKYVDYMVDGDKDKMDYWSMIESELEFRRDGYNGQKEANFYRSDNFTNQ